MPYSKNYQQPVIIEPPKVAQQAIIWLHGLGADGYDFVDILEYINLGPSHSIRFVFPHAPVIPVTINGGTAMRAWYDIIAINTDRRTVDKEGIDKSSEALYQLVLEQMQQGIDPSKIIIAGFSQGGVIAYALTELIRQKTKQKVAGLICLSTYFPFDLSNLDSTLAGNIPAFIGHGNKDKIVPFQLGKHCRDCLVQAGYDVEFHVYSMEHSVCSEEITDVSSWLHEKLELS